MKKLIHEAHRRSLWQVLGIYLAGSWIALQVVAQLADSVGLPGLGGTVRARTARDWPPDRHGDGVRAGGRGAGQGRA